MKQSETLGREYNTLTSKIINSLKELTNNQKFDVTLIDIQGYNIQSLQDNWVICGEFQYPVDDLNIVDALKLLAIVENLLITKHKEVNSFVGY